MMRQGPVWQQKTHSNPDTLLIEAHPLVRTGIAHLLRTLKGVTAVTVVEPDEGMFDAIEANSEAGLLVIGLPLPHLDELSAIGEIMHRPHARHVVVLAESESPDIIRMLNSAFDACTDAREDYYPLALRADIDAVNQRVYDGVNNGVYRVGLARSQEAYDEAFDALFATLDWLDARLATQRYLLAARVTEADWRLLASLLRFDLVYHGLFKCNQRTIASYPALSNYLRELYQMPGVAETVNVQHFVRGYYSITHVNPNGIIPRGPALYEQWLREPHDRDRWPSVSACGA